VAVLGSRISVLASALVRVTVTEGAASGAGKPCCMQARRYAGARSDPPLHRSAFTYSDLRICCEVRELWATGLVPVVTFLLIKQSPMYGSYRCSVSAPESDRCRVVRDAPHLGEPPPECVLSLRWARHPPLSPPGMAVSTACATCALYSCPVVCYVRAVLLPCLPCQTSLGLLCV